MRSLHSHVFCKLAGVDKEALIGTAAAIGALAAIPTLAGALSGASASNKRRLWEEEYGKEQRRAGGISVAGKKYFEMQKPTTGLLTGAGWGGLTGFLIGGVPGIVGGAALGALGGAGGIAADRWMHRKLNKDEYERAMKRL